MFRRWRHRMSVRSVPNSTYGHRCRFQSFSIRRTMCWTHTRSQELLDTERGGRVSSHTRVVVTALPFPPWTSAVLSLPELRDAYQ
jgi:hypothetical protein